MNYQNCFSRAFGADLCMYAMKVIHRIALVRRVDLRSSAFFGEIPAGSEGRVRWISIDAVVLALEL